MMSWVALAAIASQARASDPEDYKFDGCMLDSMLISVDGYHITVVESSSGDTIGGDLEGKRLTFRGLLNPGDFITHLREVVVGKTCDLFYQPEYRKGLAMTYWTRARSVARHQDYQAALRWLDKAEQYDKSCFYKVTRVTLLLLLREKDKALALLSKLVDPLCAEDVVNLTKMASILGKQDPIMILCDGDSTCSKLLGLFISQW